MEYYLHRQNGSVATGFALRNLGGMSDAGIEANYIPLTYDYPEYDSRYEQISPVGAPVVNKAKTAAVQHFEVTRLADDVLKELLDARKRQRIEELDAAWKEAEEKGGVVQSSVGFPIDASIRADRDVRGLITLIEETGASHATFRDANNEFHEVSLQDLKKMQVEIIMYGQNIYAQKWRMRSEIEAAADYDAIDAVKITFGANDNQG